MLVELLVDCEAFDIRLSLTGNDGLNVNALPDALTPSLLARVKHHKAELLALLASPTVDPDTRRQIHAEMIERANARYRDGPIDWPKLDDTTERFWRAEALADVVQVAAESVANVTRHNG